MSIGIVLTLVLTAITGMIAFPGVAHTEEEPLEVIFYAVVLAGAPYLGASAPPKFLVLPFYLDSS